jgi:tetratricopeptide (TPR) repeat protein
VRANAAFLPLGRTLDECRGFITANSPKRRPAYAKLAASSNPYLRAEGLWGTERYQEANDQFRDLIKQFPKNADYRVRWGHLFFERFNSEEAHGLFEEALKIDKKNAQAYLGIAQVESEGFSKHAVEAAQKAADLDPKLVPSARAAGLSRARRQRRRHAAKQADLASAISAKRWTPWRFTLAIDFCTTRTTRPGSIASSKSIRPTAKLTPRPDISTSSIGATTRAFALIARRSN